MRFELVFVVLFAVSTAVAIAARRLDVPYTIALVVAGVALGAVRVLPAPHLTKELLYAVFLPGLLFEAAFHLEFESFWRNKVAINVLTVPGVIAAIALTATVLTPTARALRVVDHFGASEALVFATLIVATDPIAVVALFKSLGAPKRLAILVEGESLLNDGTGIVLFTLALTFVQGSGLSLGGAALAFVKVVGMGAAVGTAFGLVASRVTATLEDPMVEITITTIAAYGSFAVAEQFHFSGVIATVTAGMWCGSYGARVGMSPTTRIAVESFWEYVAFALNSVVFLLIGFEVRPGVLLAAWKPIVVAWIAVTLGRAVVIALVTAALRRSRERIPWRWSVVLTWGGLRGGLSMVLALGLPQQFPHRELLVTMTFGVVILSIVVQGMTMGPVLRALGLVNRSAVRVAAERRRAALISARAARRALEEVVEKGVVSRELAAPLAEQIDRDLTKRETELSALHLEAAELRAEARSTAEREIIVAQQDAVMRAHRDGLLGHEVADEILAELHVRRLHLDEEATELPERSADAQDENADAQRPSGRTANRK